MLNDSSWLRLRTLVLFDEFLIMGKSKKKIKTLPDKLLTLVRSLPLLKCKIVEYDRNTDTKILQIRGKRRITQDYKTVWVRRVSFFTILTSFSERSFVFYHILLSSWERSWIFIRWTNFINGTYSDKKHDTIFSQVYPVLWNWTNLFLLLRNTSKQSSGKSSVQWW